MKKLLACLLCAVMLVSVFASCGNQKKMIVVGYTIYAPMNYTDDSGELIGFDTDLAKAVFEKLGYTVSFKLINWDNRYMELESGTVDCLWNGFTANTADDDGVARSAKVDFSYNYMLNKQVIVTKADFAATVTGKESFAGKVGSAEKGSAGMSYLGGFEGAISKDSDSQLSALRDLTLGTVDFVVLDEQLAKAYVGKGDYAGLATVDSVSSDTEYYAIGFGKGSELVAKVNGVLEEMAKDGSLLEIAKRYALENAVLTDFADQK